MVYSSTPVLDEPFDRSILKRFQQLDRDRSDPNLKYINTLGVNPHLLSRLCPEQMIKMDCILYALYCNADMVDP